MHYDHDNYITHCVIARVALKIGLWVYKSLVIISENYSILVKMELIHLEFVSSSFGFFTWNSNEGIRQLIEPGVTQRAY